MDPSRFTKTTLTLIIVVFMLFFFTSTIYATDGALEHFGPAMLVVSAIGSVGLGSVLMYMYLESKKTKKDRPDIFE